MRIPKELKLNKFKLVQIPRPIEYVQRFGLIPSPSAKYSGDDSSPFRQNKTDALASAQARLMADSKDFKSDEK